MTAEDALGLGPNSVGEMGDSLSEELLGAAEQAVEPEVSETTAENRRQQAVQAAMADYEPFDLATELPRMRAELTGLHADAAGNGLEDARAKLRELRARAVPGSGSALGAEIYRQSKHVQHLRRGINERREQYTLEVATQDLGIARTLGELFEQVHQPGQTPEQLWATVAAAAPKYRLSERHLTLLYDGLDEYAQKHAAVEQCRADHPDDTELFQYVFGFAPQGAVEVVTCPMALYIKCANDQDYVRAYHRLEAGDAVTPEHQRVANLSGGAALNEVKDPSLKGVITLENSQHLPRGFDQVVVRTQHHLGPIHPGYLITERIKSLEFTSPSGEQWRVEQVWSPDAPDLEFRVVRAYDPNHSVHHFVINEAGDVWKDGQRSPNQKGECFVGGVGFAISDFEIIIVPTSDLNVFSEGINDVRSTQPKPEKSAAIQLHEEQHQFNKLFQNLTAAVGDRELALRVGQQDLPPDAAAAQFVSSLARARRAAMGVDGRVRDELIAFLQEGESNLEEIRSTLKSGEAYDFQRLLSKQIAGLTTKIAGVFMTYEGLISPNAGPQTKPPITRAQIDEAVGEAFGPGHKRNIDRSIDAIDALVSKGYLRDEIIGLVYQWPLHRWPGLARSMPNREEITTVPL